MREIGIGLLGFGTVGAGVVEGLLKNGDLMSERAGVRPVLRKVADIDLESDRGVTLDRSLLTTDADSVIADPGVDIVVELIGGTGVAKEMLEKALKAGKPVVTANKALLAEHGSTIFPLAAEKNVDLYFGASVGGGIPIIRSLREGLIANRIDSIRAILNGTCNYILTRMEEASMAFEKALEEAQRKGYAEADPGLDIDGIDTAHKAVLLASLAYGFMVPMSDVHVEGIRGLAQTEIQYARDLGYRIKLLAIVKKSDGLPEVRVHPTLIPVGHVLASVSGAYNAVMVKTDLAGDTLYYGLGAGRRPTASTVLGDIMDVARNLVGQTPGRVRAVSLSREPQRLRKVRDIMCRQYLRLSLLDEPGVLSKISAALGKHGISIASVLQKEGRDGNYVPVVVITHEAGEGSVDAAMAEIDGLDVVGAPTVRLRIED